MTMRDQWLPPPHRLVLAPGEVHVWRVSLDAPAKQIEPLIRTLSPDEQRRAERFTVTRVRQRFVVGRGALRAILAMYTGVAAGKIRFRYSAAGKPALAAPHGTDLQFNAAHSGGLALFAVGHGGALGVDLEQIRPLHNAAQLAARICSPHERGAWHALPSDQRTEALLRCWTAKEAFVKARGDGLAQPLHQIAVKPLLWEAARRFSIGIDNGTDPWTLLPLHAAPGFVAALVSAKIGSMLHWQWPDWW